MKRGNRVVALVGMKSPVAVDETEQTTFPDLLTS